LKEQVLLLAQLAQDRAAAGVFAPLEVETLFDEIGLPRPSKVSNYLMALQTAGMLTRLKEVRGAWKLTPRGKIEVQRLTTGMDLTALTAEAAQPGVAVLGDTAHPVVPPSLAPPALLGPLHEFLAEFPFEQNIFGMTRFPSSNADGSPDPIAPAIQRAGEVCSQFGFKFHLASDRSIVDDLWSNVAAHMWGCRYGIAFYEARTDRGLNYNLNIEVGSCLVLGRRLALLKDHSLDAMPTDLVGQIYFGVDIDDPDTIGDALTAWIQNSLL
jgi:hypothetical protein